MTETGDFVSIVALERVDPQRNDFRSYALPITPTSLGKRSLGNG